MPDTVSRFAEIYTTLQQVELGHRYSPAHLAYLPVVGVVEGAGGALPHGASLSLAPRPTTSSSWSLLRCRTRAALHSSTPIHLFNRLVTFHGAAVLALFLTFTCLKVPTVSPSSSATRVSFRIAMMHSVTSIPPLLMLLLKSYATKAPPHLFLLRHLSFPPIIFKISPPSLLLPLLALPRCQHVRSLRLVFRVTLGLQLPVHIVPAL